MQHFRGCKRRRTFHFFVLYIECFYFQLIYCQLFQRFLIACIVRGARISENILRLRRLKRMGTTNLEVLNTKVYKLITEN